MDPSHTVPILCLSVKDDTIFTVLTTIFVFFLG